MELFSRQYGDVGRPAVVVLHGLLGSSRNWHSVARALSSEHDVRALDLRNHGRSPHHPEHSIVAMAGDVHGWLGSSRLERVSLLGHSMGGKVAMRVAADAPHRIDRLIVVDIAPRPYAPVSRELRALRSLDPGSLRSRREADELLAREIPDPDLRAFLLTNLAWREGGGYRWRANVPVLERGLGELRAAPLAAGETYDGPTLFIAGGRSGYVREGDREEILRHFPNARVVVFERSGHNPHVDERERFVETVAAFLRELPDEAPRPRAAEDPEDG